MDRHGQQRCRLWRTTGSGWGGGLLLSGQGGSLSLRLQKYKEDKERSESRADSCLCQGSFTMTICLISQDGSHVPPTLPLNHHYTHCPRALQFSSCFYPRCAGGAEATYPAQPEKCSSQHSRGDHHGGSFPKPGMGGGPKESQPEGRNVLRAERGIRCRNYSLLHRALGKAAR